MVVAPLALGARVVIDVRDVEGVLYVRVGDRAVRMPRLLPKDFVIEAQREWQHRHWPQALATLVLANGVRNASR